MVREAFPLSSSSCILLVAPRGAQTLAVLISDFRGQEMQLGRQPVIRVTGVLARNQTVAVYSPLTNSFHDWVNRFPGHARISVHISESSTVYGSKPLGKGDD